MTQMGPDAELAMRINALTERIIGCAFRVGKVLGLGFLEKVYENALAHELRTAGIAFTRQVRLQVWYDGIVVGDYIADFVVEELVLVELKAGAALDPSHEAQCLNYLAATKLPICLLLNFGPRVQVKRVVGPAAPRFPSTGSRSDKPPDMTWSEYAES